MNNWLQEDGYSLIETLIAMAILMVIVVPTIMFLTYIGNNHLVNDRIESFQIARNEMETVIATKNDSSSIKHIDKWVIKRTIKRKNELHYLIVDVFEKDTLKLPVITLETARIWNMK